ncbi:MAG: dihydrofolate reductase [Clostridia bacterium]|nr:dihydrofolate reductase [Clostridia bacterium]
MISLILAMDKNRTIGLENKLPWRLPADLAYFKKVTMGHAVIMGRKTFESIGKPLPGRRNIIISRNNSYTAEGCTVYNSVEEVVDSVGDEDVFVIGGANIYNEFINYAQRLYITLIEETFIGDAFFPEIDSAGWKLISKEKGIKDEKNPYDYCFMLYDRLR